MTMPRLSGGRSARQYVLWAFKLRGCVDCGYMPQTKDDLRLLHCDHRDPTEKVPFGSRSLTKATDGLLGANSLDDLLDELWKCDPVCVDCHIKRGRQRKIRDQGELPLAIKEWIAEGVHEVVEGEQGELSIE